MKLKSIVFICNKFPPEVDGVGEYVYFFAKALRDKRIKVSVITRSNPNLVDCFENIQIYPCIKSWNTQGFREVNSLLEKIKPQYIFLQYVPYSFQRYGIPILLPLALLWWKKKTSIIIMFHEVRIRWLWNRPKTWVVSSLQWVIARLIHYQSAINFTSIEFYKKYLPSPTHLLPIGSNIPMVEIDQSHLNELRESMLESDSAPVIISFGIRNLKLLTVAFVKLKQEFPKAVLLVFGKGIELPTQEGIICLGYQPSFEIYHYFNLGSIFVVLDYSSSQGKGGSSNKSGTLAAAMASGLPVIGIKGDMNNPILKHGENIWLSEYNIQKLSEDLLLLAKNEELRQKLVANAKKTFEENLTWEVIAEKLLHFLSKNEI